jgi:hypothetical protein
LFEDNVDAYKYLKLFQDLSPCPNPHFKPKVKMVTPPSETNPITKKFAEQYIENLRIPNALFENIDVAKEEIVQQTMELQLSAYNWWKEQANPYISEQFQRIYENEMIK